MVHQIAILMCKLLCGVSLDSPAEVSEVEGMMGYIVMLDKFSPGRNTTNIVSIDS